MAMEHGGGFIYGLGCQTYPMLKHGWAPTTTGVAQALRTYQEGQPATMAITACVAVPDHVERVYAHVSTRLAGAMEQGGGYALCDQAQLEAWVTEALQAL